MVLILCYLNITRRLLFDIVGLRMIQTPNVKFIRTESRNNNVPQKYLQLINLFLNCVVCFGLHYHLIRNKHGGVNFGMSV